MISNVIINAELISKYFDYKTESKGLVFLFQISTVSHIKTSLISEILTEIKEEEIHCIDYYGQTWESSMENGVFEIVVFCLIPSEIADSLDNLDDQVRDRFLELDERIYTEINFSGIDDELLDCYEGFFNDISEEVDKKYTKRYEKHISHLIESKNDMYFVNNKNYSSYSEAFNAAANQDKIWSALKDK